MKNFLPMISKDEVDKYPGENLLEWCRKEKFNGKT